jgi:hypothetical protein
MGRAYDRQRPRRVPLPGEQARLTPAIGPTLTLDVHDLRPDRSSPCEAAKPHRVRMITDDPFGA